MARKKAAVTIKEEPENEELCAVDTIKKAWATKADNEEHDSEGAEYFNSGRRKRKRKTPVKKEIKKEPKEEPKKECKKEPPVWECHSIQWDDCDSDADTQNSWEPECNLAQCDFLLTDFWEHVDNEDYQLGYIAQAKDSWIRGLEGSRREYYFAKELSNESLQKEKKDDKKPRKMTRNSRRAKR